MGSARVKLSDVAREAGVSTSTASFTLSGRGDEMRISAAAQERVRDAAARLGYRRNAVSVGLRKGSTRTIGFVSDNVTTSPHAGEMIRGALDASREAGYMLFIVESGGDPVDEARVTEGLLDRQVDGIILASMFTQVRPRPRLDHGLPVVLLNSLPDDPAWGIAAVVPDEVAAGRTAARRLLEWSARRLHVVGAGPTTAQMPVGSVAARERHEGILETLAAEGLAPASQRGSLDWEPEDGLRIGNELIADGVRGDAVIAMNDPVALGVVQALRESGLTVPDDVSLVSFDDAHIARHLRPALTSIGLPHYELGHLATTLLVRAMTAGTPPEGIACEVHRVRMPLRERASAAPVR